ncbi:hypothetical protein HPT27_01305 [Permianibacter sp. IMCC34836]|uniref:hypothetical protein n=1 Tax=Permianibacter fluminis TaxID=2738515 RepID=UPI0015568CCC|nr:hypothetical protein [Permianibacter fluminis]NQD35639.1 hypothetical protein [Permianibacter fluminis]
MSDIWFPLFGVYLLVGAGYSFITAKWFPGFPPQLDVFMIFGHPLGAYIEGIIAALLGAVLIYFSWRAAGKAKRQQ